MSSIWDLSGSIRTVTMAPLKMLLHKAGARYHSTYIMFPPTFRATGKALGTIVVHWVADPMILENTRWSHEYACNASAEVKRTSYKMLEY